MQFSSPVVISLSITCTTSAEQIRRLRNGERGIVGSGGEEPLGLREYSLVDSIPPVVVRKAKAEKELSLNMTSSLGTCCFRVLNAHFK